MNTQPPSDLGAFHGFVGEKVRTGESSLSPEDVLDEWRRLHPDPLAAEDELAAIQEAIDDMAQGDNGVPFDEFDRDSRLRHGLSEP